MEVYYTNVMMITRSKRSSSLLMLDGPVNVILQFWGRFNERLIAELGRYVWLKIIRFKILLPMTLSCITEHLPFGRWITVP